MSALALYFTLLPFQTIVLRFFFLYLIQGTTHYPIPGKSLVLHYFPLRITKNGSFPKHIQCHTWNGKHYTGGRQKMFIGGEMITDITLTNMVMIQTSTGKLLHHQLHYENEP